MLKNAFNTRNLPNTIAQPHLSVFRTLTVSCTRALTLSFVSRIITFLFFSPEAGDMDGCFADVRGWERKAQHLKQLTTRGTVEHGVLAHVIMGLTGAYAHCLCPASWERVAPLITSPEKRSQFRFEMWFLLNVYHLCIIIMSKKGKQSILSCRLSIFTKSKGQLENELLKGLWWLEWCPNPLKI